MSEHKKISPDTSGLLQDLGHKIGRVSELSQLVEHTVKMGKRVLHAEAASVLLHNEKSRELYFEVVQGTAGRILKKICINSDAGIAGWVLKHGITLIVNDVAEDIRFERSVDKATGFTTRSIICVPLVVHRQINGVLEVLNKMDGSDFNEQDREILESLAAVTAIALENSRLHESVLAGYKGTIGALAAAIDAKDPYTCGHSRRVMEYALMAGVELSLPKKTLEIIEYAGLLHDIGKIGIADNILGKPAVLTEGESDIMNTHCEIGANILKDVPFLEEARELIKHHHERYDGKGYPDGLAGEEIPVGARLLAVADSFDTMTTDRAYRKALGTDYAICELQKCSGTQFCPVAVRTFLTSLEKKERSSNLSKAWSI